MDANTVLTITCMLMNRSERNCLKKDAFQKLQINLTSLGKLSNYLQLMASKDKKPVGKLSAIHPSGKREESFFELVFDIARQIPYGRVTSYGAIAVCLGTKLSARMVGWAMRGAHHKEAAVPAHRVVNRNGMLTGKHHFETPTQMQELLEKEGIKVVDDTIVNFKKVFWNPSEELL